MRTNFTVWILIGAVAGTTLGLVISNIIAGVSCCCAIANLPVLFAKKKNKNAGTTCGIKMNIT
jgi:hypothetical protein